MFESANLLKKRFLWSGLFFVQFSYLFLLVLLVVFVLLVISVVVFASFADT